MVRGYGGIIGHICYIHLTWPSRGQLGILQQGFLGQKCDHTYVISYGETQKPYSVMCRVDWYQLISKWDALNIVM